MTPDDLLPLILQVLKEVQELSGRPWHPLTSGTVPIGTLDGFDSLSGVEATVMIEEKLGCTLGIDSAFVSEDGNTALTLKAVCDRVATLAASSKANA